MPRHRKRSSHDACRGTAHCHPHYADNRVIDCGGHGLPDRDDIVELIKSVIDDIDDDCRTSDDPDDATPGINLTIGYSPDDGSWGYQTGDNSFTGGAYGHPHWSVQGVYRDTNPEELADEIMSEIADLCNS